MLECRRGDGAGAGRFAAVGELEKWERDGAGLEESRFRIVIGELGVLKSSEADA